jgi:UDP-glucose 4-epimerase
MTPQFNPVANDPGANMFAGKTLLITGGTGSFGNALLKRVMHTDVKEIRILSRDEKKQDDMRMKYQSSKLKFYVGDVRDYRSVLSAARGVDYIFHAAALKQVPSCEFHPIEAVKTNVMGTENVIEAALAAGVKRMVCLSTDKAVYPVNAMGMSKAMMEKVVVAKSRASDETIICTTRYGNVLATRGSVIPLFIEQIRSGQPITITDPSMTRFMLTLEDAVDLVFAAFENGKPGDIFVQKAPAVTIRVLAEALINVMNAADHPIRIIGTRHGEKQHETLLRREEVAVADDLGNYFRIPADMRDLNYGKFLDQGETSISTAEDYNSNNAQNLSLDAMVSFLKALPFVQAAVLGAYEQPEI